MIYDKDNLQMTMIQQLADLAGRAILEVGCGDGRLSVMLARTTRWTGFTYLLYKNTMTPPRRTGQVRGDHLQRLLG